MTTSRRIITESPVKNRCHRLLGPVVIGLCIIVGLVNGNVPAAQAREGHPIPGGQLQIIGDEDASQGGVCPLKYTDVQAEISGYVARVSVKQVFHNPTDRKIEAVYVFPLPQDAAVDDMVMVVGDRRIVGQIRGRDEAREIYEQARAAGHVASLLDQERPNIFTQSVANIEPGVEVAIEISYVETLKYEDGEFEWVFPMVVGPRYIPGGGSAPEPMTRGKPTGEVPDADRITPPVTPEGTRAGHDISLAVTIVPGLPLHDVRSELHEVEVQKLDGEANGAMRVALKNQTEIPNRDFVLHYKLGGEGIGDAFLRHSDERGQFFTLVLQPPERVVPEQLVPRELIFVLDTSGSMSGMPIEKAKELMNKLIGSMREGDTFNVITFAGDTRILWKSPLPATNENINTAQYFLSKQHGRGGTEMMKAINAALVQTVKEPAAGEVLPIRIVCFMTDGYVGNDFAIVDAVQKNADTTRVFSFGVGNSVNRFLLDEMSHAGRGEVEYVTLGSQADAAVERFHERVLAPVLTDIEIDWGTLPVSEVYPERIPDLFSAQPIMVHGKLDSTVGGTIVLRGNTGAGAYDEAIDVTWPEETPEQDVLASLWARSKVKHLMMQDYAALQRQEFPDELKREITELGLEYRLMTQFTSFVAVEELTVTSGGEPMKIDVPVEMPEGVSYEGVFGGSVPGNMPAVGGMSGQSQMRRARGLYMGVPATPAAGGKMATGRAPRESEALVDAEEAAGEALSLEERRQMKLAEPLRELAAQVERQGRSGNLALSSVKVVDWRVDVVLVLSDVSEKTRAALAELGFEVTGESKATSVLIGSIDVRKLEALAELDVVRQVRPVPTKRSR